MKQINRPVFPWRTPSIPYDHGVPDVLLLDLVQVFRNLVLEKNNSLFDLIFYNLRVFIKE